MIRLAVLGAGILGCGNCFAHLKLAPELAIGFPQVYQVGAEAQCDEGPGFPSGWAVCNEKFRAYLRGSFLPLSIADRSLQSMGVEAGVRALPVNSWFFVGLGLGYRRINIAANLSSFQIAGESVATGASIGLNTFYVTPVAGLEFKISQSLTLGMDAGVQFPVISSGFLQFVDNSSGTNSNTSSLLQVGSDSSQAMGRVAGLIIPTLTLVRLTYSFDSDMQR